MTMGFSGLPNDPDGLQEAKGAGELPDRAPDRLSGGLGSGANCAICGRCVNADELEFELEFAAGGNGGPADRYTVHVGCFSARKSRRQVLQTAPATVAAGELSVADGEIRFGADAREPPTEQGAA
jgi:hypothetical protein